MRVIVSDEIRQVASEVEAILKRNGISDSRLEAEVLLRHALQYDRAQFYASLNEHISAKHIQHIHVLVERRIAREPLAYITGQREFYGLDFLVSPNVLIPRQETELLVDAALAFAREHSNDGIAIADIGTGSGAVAIAIGVNLPDSLVYATDSSAAALEVANCNRQRHGVANRVSLHRGDLLAPIVQRVELIVSNPPYIANHLLPGLPPEVLREPQLALDGGDQGLEVIRRLLEQAPSKLKAGGRLMLEISPEQLEQVCAMAQEQFPGSNIKCINDLLGLARCITIST